ncbi:FeoB-associated Cys-rich membrane protein [Alkalibacter mobilis]|nr:FeoB-associated Cys-rich membrane protein [Alkalibacter mobilis]MBF7096492.1 FeoB-associated Cys-rich membrane protein [Alkalibacter mobilis]
MADFLILTPILGLTVYFIVRHFRQTKEGKCSSCSHDCSSCPTKEKM